MKLNDLTVAMMENGTDNDKPVRVPPDEKAHGATSPSTVEEVRQGHTGDHVRYILMASGAAAAIVLFAVLFGWIG